jgi:hypothetical protein
VVFKIGTYVKNQVFERVGLVKLKRVSRLRLDVNSDNIKSRSMVSHTCPTGPAKQVK